MGFSRAILPEQAEVKIGKQVPIFLLIFNNIRKQYDLYIFEIILNPLCLKMRMQKLK